MRDPEGILSTVPAVATALLGVFTGRFHHLGAVGGKDGSACSSLAGVACLGLGALMHLAFPINKNLWSSSFVLWCGGWSLLLVAGNSTL